MESAASRFHSLSHEIACAIADDAIGFAAEKLLPLVCHELRKLAVQ
jgi:hypothetical protein